MQFHDFQVHNFDINEMAQSVPAEESVVPVIIITADAI